MFAPECFFLALSPSKKKEQDGCLYIISFQAFSKHTHGVGPSLPKIFSSAAKVFSEEGSRNKFRTIVFRSSPRWITGLSLFSLCVPSGFRFCLVLFFFFIFSVFRLSGLSLFFVVCSLRFRFYLSSSYFFFLFFEKQIVNLGIFFFWRDSFAKKYFPSLFWVEIIKKQLIHLELLLFSLFPLPFFRTYRYTNKQTPKKLTRNKQQQRKEVKSASVCVCAKVETTDLSKVQLVVGGKTLVLPIMSVGTQEDKV